MKKCPPPSSKDDDLTLEFPDETEFTSESPQIDPQVMLRRVAETMSLRKRRPGEDARRAAEKIPVEFVL